MSLVFSNVTVQNFMIRGSRIVKICATLQCAKRSEVPPSYIKSILFVKNFVFVKGWQFLVLIVRVLFFAIMSRWLPCTLDVSAESLPLFCFLYLSFCWSTHVSLSFWSNVRSCHMTYDMTHVSLRSIFCTLNFRVWRFWMLTNRLTGIVCHQLSSSGQKNARIENYCLRNRQCCYIGNVHLVKDHMGSLWPGGKKIEKPCRRSGKSFGK